MANEISNLHIKNKELEGEKIRQSEAMALLKADFDALQAKYQALQTALALRDAKLREADLRPVDDPQLREKVAELESKLNRLQERLTHAYKVERRSKDEMIKAERLHKDVCATLKLNLDTEHNLRLEELRMEKADLEKAAEQTKTSHEIELKKLDSAAMMLKEDKTQLQQHVENATAELRESREHTTRLQTALCQANDHIKQNSLIVEELAKITIDKDEYTRLGQAILHGHEAFSRLQVACEELQSVHQQPNAELEQTRSTLR